MAIIGGRIQVAGGAIETAAHDAARAASISRTAAHARTNAHTAAEATLTQHGLHCTHLDVTVDTSGFTVPVGQPATVSADVTCVVDFTDLLPAGGLPGTKRLHPRSPPAQPRPAPAQAAGRDVPATTRTATRRRP